MSISPNQDKYQEENLDDFDTSVQCEEVYPEEMIFFWAEEYDAYRQ